MNRILIPSILLATVLVAGFFAFAPVEKVSTVHTTIADNIEQKTQTATFTTDAITAQNDKVLIVLDGTETFTGDVVLSSAGGTCLVEDAGGTLLVTAADGIVATAALSNAGGGTPSGFLEGEDIQLDTPANTSCYVTFIVDEWEG